MASGWERIYIEEGDLGFAVLPKIEKASEAFKKNNYRMILDLGCGTGRHSIFLAQLGFSVDAVDGSPTGIAIAEAKARSLGIDSIRFSLHDMKAISFPNESYDAIVCTWTIYHATLAGIRSTLSEIRRVLRPGGTLITDFLSVGDSTYGLGRSIEPGTFVGQKPGEEDVPHHYSTRREVVQLLRDFRQTSIRAQSRSYVADGTEYVRQYFDAEAVK